MLSTDNIKQIRNPAKYIWT